MDELMAAAVVVSASSKQNETEDEVGFVDLPEQEHIMEKRIITIEEFLGNRNEYTLYEGDLKVTGKAPQDCEGLFAECYYIVKLDLSDLDTSDVTSMADRFKSCFVLEEINLRNFNTSNVTNMSGMFTYCFALKNIDLSGFDMAKVQNMNNMFSSCHKLDVIDISHFNICQVVTMERMFENCTNLKHVELPIMNLMSEPIKLRDMSYMFAFCKNLEHVDMSNYIDSLYAGVIKAVYIDMMFYNCPAGEEYRDHPFFTMALLRSKWQR